MPNRIVRSELLDSEAWLSLKGNEDRCAYLALLLTADNFGDMPAGPHRLVRLWRPFGIDTPEKAAKALLDLADVDLIRRYEANAKPYLHIPRFGQRMRYTRHAWPLSPWATNEDKHTLAQNRLPSGGDPRRLAASSGKEVEVEVEVEVDKNLRSKALARATRLPADWQLPNDWKTWAVEAFNLDPRQVVGISLAFRDYWIAKAGKDACKVDWQATWRNWIRRETANA